MNHREVRAKVLSMPRPEQAGTATACTCIPLLAVTVPKSEIVSGFAYHEETGEEIMNFDDVGCFGSR